MIVIPGSTERVLTESRRVFKQEPLTGEGVLQGHGTRHLFWLNSAMCAVFLFLPFLIFLSPSLPGYLVQCLSVTCHFFEIILSLSAVSDIIV